MKRFWISWIQLTIDYRPLQDPPQPENIKAWWCSGKDSRDCAILCAIVDAPDAGAAQGFIERAWDSSGQDVGDFRFIEEREQDWLPNDRFPITKDWEKQRLNLG